MSNAYGNTSQRVGRLKGEILAHAIPCEVLAITGQRKKMPKNNSKTVLYRRWLPYGATVASPNTWNVDAAAHVTQEGVTPPADSMVPQDVSVQLQQYSCLYALTDQSVDLHEDGAELPEEMKKLTGERMGLVREMVRYGALKACTNRFYAGGSSRATVASKVTLPLLRKITRSLKANHGRFITSILASSPNYETRAVEASFLVFCHTDGEADIRDLAGFTPVAEYGQRKPVHEMEIGSVENFRFVVSPELNSYPNAGVAVGSTGLFSTNTVNIDVYPFIVVAEDAWGDVALRGMDSFDPTYIPPGQKDKNDPLGQRGYVGAKFYSAALVLNPGWMAVAECGVTNLA